MSEAVRDLRAAWPFLPGGTVDAAVKNILDVRIVYDLPAMDALDSSSNADLVSVTLSSISAGYMAFTLALPGYGHTATIANVPVYVGRDSYPTTESYVITRETPAPVLLSRTYRLHPDCLLLRQLPPTLTFQLRTGISADTETSTTSDYTFSGAIKFANGHNVAVQGNATGVIWAGTAAAGLGAYAEMPFTEFEGKTIVYGKGLRSINGLTNEVHFQRKGSSVTLEVEKNTTDISVTIGSAQ